MKKTITLLVAAAAFISSRPSFAVEKAWNDSSTDFNGSSSWTTAGAITSSDAATMGIDASISNQPNLTAPITIQQVRFLGAGYTLSGSGGALTLTSVGTTNVASTGAAIVTASTAGTTQISSDIILGAAASAVQTFLAGNSNNLTISGNVTAANATMVLALNAGASSEITISGNINIGTGRVSKSNALGVLKLTGTNSSYSGSTTVGTGVLEVTKLANGGVNSSIGSSSSTSTNLLLSGGVLRYVGSGDSTDRLAQFNAASTIESSGAGAVNFTNTGNATVNSSFRGLSLGGSNTGDNTLAWLVNGGASSGVNSITKADAGKWILTNANTYASTTTVNAGTLLINGSHTGGGNYSVTGILGGSGTIAMAAAATAIVNSGGYIAPGANVGQIGTLTFNGTTQTGTVATFASGAKFAFDLNATSVTSDRLALINGATSDFVFNSNVIEFGVVGSLVSGQSYTLFSSNVAGAYSGLTFDGSNYVTAGLSFTGLSGAFQTDSKIQLVGNNLVLQAVPEPATWALLAFSLTTVVIFRRRQTA